MYLSKQIALVKFIYVYQLSISITTDELLSTLPHSTISGKGGRRGGKGGKRGENYSYYHLIVR